MTVMRINIAEYIVAPVGSNIEIAPTGNAMGIRLPDGRLLKPWIVYEIEDNSGEPRDLSHDELIELGVDHGHDYVRTIEEADEILDRAA